PWRWLHDRRTSVIVTLGTLVAVVAVYVVVVVGGSALLGRGHSPSVGLSVLATALVALGLEPFSSYLRSVVTEHLEHGRRAPYDVLSGFTESLVDPGDDSAAGDVPSRLARHLATGTDASWAQVWLVVGGVPELAATWPPEGDPGQAGGDAERGVHEREVV